MIEMNKIKLPYMNPEIVSKEIGDFVISQVLDAESTGCVIGLSGGIDSTTTAALIKRAFDKYNSHQSKIMHPGEEMPLEIVGYMLPSKINSSKDTEDGVRVAKKLGIRYEIIELDPIVEACRYTNPEVFKNFEGAKYDKGNMISRIRGNVLSTKAATENKLVAGTGNKDEDFGVGYYTLFGDGAVHLSPIGGLSKRLVRQMAEYLGVDKDLVYREPTAGLEPGQTDFGDLGYKYDVVELVSEGLTQGYGRNELITNPQIINLVNEQLKIVKKFDDVGEVVDDILRRNKIAHVKSNILHPPSPTISLEYR